MVRHFDVVVVENIPVLTLKDHNAARRFITFVDELYESKTPLLSSAAASPERLFVGGKKVTGTDTDSGDCNGSASLEGEKMLGVDQAVHHGRAVGALASVRELSFAFERAASRLKEMSSRLWWDKATLSAWRPQQSNTR